MKLETTLEERPGFLHALPLFDLFALVAMLLLLGPMFLTQGGVMVEVPTSQFQMQRYRESIVVTLEPGNSEAQLYLGRTAITIDELAVELEKFKADETMSRAIVLLKTDAGSSVGVERKVSEIILKSGFRLAYVGRSKSKDRLENTGSGGDR